MDVSINQHSVSLSFDRVAKMVGYNGLRNSLDEDAMEMDSVKIGISLLTKWCRLNCRSPGEPVIVNGKASWVFKNLADAMLFKLTWA